LHRIHSLAILTRRGTWNLLSGNAVVMRRTGLGTLGDPGEAALRQVAGLMAGELGWDAARVESEVRECAEVLAW